MSADASDTIMIIDIYTHLAPRSFLDRMVLLAPKLGNIVNRLLAVKPLSNLDIRFRDMDQIPDYRQLICLPNPSLEEIGPAETGVELARIANDELAELCRLHPDRFVGFAASVYLDDVDAAIREAERAIHQLGAKGVLIYNHVAGHPLDEERFRPFFAAIADWKRPLWLHPTRSANSPDYASETKSRFEMWWCFGWPYDTSVAMTRLVLDGLFDRHPDLEIITHHCGGMIPFFDGRVGPGLDVLGARTSDEDYSSILPALKRPHLDYFKQFYGDTAMFGATTGVRCGLEFFGPSKIVFATDAPLGPIRKTFDGINHMDLDAATKAAIFHDNAARLLRL
jgi:predicted TIM-barrel fold metal-dependent hydrolase